jgi:hypothetical protein
VKRDIEEDFRRWKDLPCSWIDRINIVKMGILPKSNLHVQRSPYQNYNDILHRNRNNNLEIQKTLNSQSSSEQKVQCWRHYNIWPQTILQRHNNKNSMNTQWRKYSFFNKHCWENWISTCRRLKLGPCLSTSTKINSKWIKDLNIRCETLKQFHEAIGNTLELIRMFREWLSKQNSKAQYLREAMNKGTVLS